MIPLDSASGNSAGKRMVGFFARLLRVLVVFSVLGTTAGFFASSWWACETCSAFRLQFALFLLLGAFQEALQRRFAMVGMLVGLFLVNGTFLVPSLVPGEPAICPATPGCPTLRLMTVNVHTANGRYDLVRGAIASFSPDIALFTEVNETWINELKPLAADFPFSASRPRPDNFGIILYSRIRPQKLEIVEVFAEELPSVEMVFPFGSRTGTLVGTHPLPPRNREYSAGRNSQLGLLGRYFHALAGPKILMGDLNTVPWSPYFTALIDEGGLTDTARGRGIAVTWPTHAWWLFGIPIDHILVSPEIQVVSRSVGPWVGSDHYPVCAELAIP